MAAAAAGAAVTFKWILFSCAVMLLLTAAVTTGQSTSADDDHPITKVETVTIINIDFQGSEDQAMIKNVVDFLRRYNFTSQDVIIPTAGKSLLRTTFSKYYQSEYVDADEYDLIKSISKDDWLSVRQAFISLVRHANRNIENKEMGSPWSTELLVPKPEADKEYTPVELPLIGFALRLSFTRECDDIAKGCLLDTKFDE